jgi:acyl-CoA thioester hydrolase
MNLLESVNPPALKSFVFPVRVYFEDTDAAGVAYYASYLRFIERARSEWLRALGYPQGKLANDTGTGFVVRSLSAEYLGPARLDDTLEVVSRLRELRRAQVVFDQRVERHGALLVGATVRVACVELGNMKPTPIPAEMHRRFRALL